MKKIILGLASAFALLGSINASADYIEEIIIIGNPSGTPPTSGEGFWRYMAAMAAAGMPVGGTTSSGGSGSSAPPPAPTPPPKPPVKPTKSKCESDMRTTTLNTLNAAALAKTATMVVCDRYTTAGNMAILIAPTLKNGYAIAAMATAGVASLAQGSSCATNADYTYITQTNAINAAHEEWIATVCSALPES